MPGSEPTRSDYAMGVVAWLLLAPLALVAVGGLIYEAVLTLSRFFGW